jgi:hypothetical protein
MSRYWELPQVLSDQTPDGPDHRSPSTPARGRLRRLLPWLLLGSLIVAAVAIVLAVREPMAELTPEALTAARHRWRQAGIRDYDTTIETTASTLGSGSVLRVRVRNGRPEQIADLTASQREITVAEPESYTIEGLFAMLERELQLSRDPSGPLSSGSGKTFLRVHFDEQYGYPRRYLRVIGGTNTSSEVRVRDFETRTPGDGLPEGAK